MTTLDPRERETMRRLLERTRDPEVHTRVWDYIEGKITKPQLYRDPAVSPVLSRWAHEQLDHARRAGFDPDRLRDYLRDNWAGAAEWDDLADRNRRQRERRGTPS